MMMVISMFMTFMTFMIETIIFVIVVVVVVSVITEDVMTMVRVICRRVKEEDRFENKMQRRRERYSKINQLQEDGCESANEKC